MNRHYLAQALGHTWQSLRAIERSKLLAILVTLVVLAIVLPSGPNMEQVFAAVANPKRESIYATAFGEFLVDKDQIFKYWPSFLDYFFVVVLSIIFSSRCRSRRSFFLSVWIWLSLSITSMDIIFANVYKTEINITFSALSNVIGGGIASGICAFVFVLCEEFHLFEKNYKLAFCTIFSCIIGFSLVAVIWTPVKTSRVRGHDLIHSVR